jgi:hypothetical protein
MDPLLRGRAALRVSSLDSSDLSTSTRVQSIEQSPGISFKTGFGLRRASALMEHWIQQCSRALFETVRRASLWMTSIPPSICEMTG